jgi:hypothetical protein
MIKILIIFLIIISYFSCRTSFVTKLPTEYTKKGKDFIYNLKLNNDSSFIMSEKYFESNSTCIGKWQRLSRDTFLLKCSDEQLSAMLQSGYMTKRFWRFIFFKKNKLILDSVILTRIK